MICVHCGAALRSVSAQTDTADLLFRIAGVLIVVSGMWNTVLSGIFFLSLIMVCVGVFWIIPAFLAVMEVAVGIVMIATGKQYRLLAFTPALGLVISLLNFNFIGITLDVLALGLGIAAYTLFRPAEEG